VGRASAGRAWVLGLVLMFILTLIQFLLVTPLRSKFAPTILSVAPSMAGNFEFVQNILWWSPYTILMLGTVIYMIAAIFKEDTNEIVF